jgi:hypothetical protein
MPWEYVSCVMCHVSCKEVYESAKAQAQFHDSLNFNAALKETLNETSFPAFSPALKIHDKSIDIDMLS